MGDLVFNGGTNVDVYDDIYLITNVKFRQIRYLGWKPTVSIIPNVSCIYLFSLHVTSLRFTVRNVTVNNAQTGIFSSWNWGEESSYIPIRPDINYIS